MFRSRSYVLQSPRDFERRFRRGTRRVRSWEFSDVDPVDKWKSRRKLLMPCFGHAMLRDYLMVFNKHSEKFVKFLEKETKQESFFVKKYFTHLTLDIICDTMFGFSTRALETDDAKYVTAVTKLEDIFLSRVYKFWLWPDFIFKLTRYYREGEKCINLLQDIVNSVFEEKKKLYLDKSKKDLKGKRKALIDVLLQLHLETQELSKEDVMEEIMTFLFSGLETVAAALMWVFLMIGLHPEVQRKIQEELDKVFGGDRERYATEDDLNALIYLSRVLKETNRLYSTVPIFGRRAPEDIDICGHTIPKGASCFILSYFLNRDEDVFPDPEKFDPDRFLPENAAKLPDCAVVPFGGGQRNCIGQMFAIMELKTILSSILRNYTIESLDSREDIIPIMRVSLYPSKNIRFRIRQRKFIKSE
ncbi:cytochrome P450 4V2 [Nephila pilipes]|uniref:aromatase n=1 Tax=Nephila pilipes TaxID=299642 RepID=A0A8X6M8R9_NEPPI|nr:cytochrome P450 4V2 [Nephila pilipes]